MDMIKRKGFRNGLASKVKVRAGRPFLAASCLCALILLGGCAATPTAPITAGDRLKLTNVTCDASIQPEQQVELDMIDRLMGAGRDHAALAKLESKSLSTEDHWLRYGQLLASTGRLNEAENVFRALVGRCDTGRAHHGLGMVLLKENEVDDALMHLKIARERVPAAPDVRNDYGYVLLLVGHYPQAAFELRTAIELGDGKGPVRQNLAVAYLLTENHAGLQWLTQQYDFTAKEKDYAEKLADQFRSAK